MHRRVGLCVALAGGLVGPLLVTGGALSPAHAAPGVSAPATRTATSASRPVSRPVSNDLLKGKAKGTPKGTPKPKGFYPTPGPIFNNPLGSRYERNKVLDKIRLAIRNVPPGGTIQIMSWNVMSAAAVGDLLAAQRRGVKVRVIMDANNLPPIIPNPDFRRLKAGLLAGDKGKKPKRRSYAKVCHFSCRGTRGQAHSKYYLFSRVGKAKHVLMEGSANLTTAAAVNQWNDIYTFVHNDTLYDFTQGIFDQAWKDMPVPAPFQSVTKGKNTLYFSPFAGPDFHGDPLQQTLDQVQCTGVAAGSGDASGHTIIRYAPDVMRGNRGLVAAQRLKQLYNQGCNVRVAYTVVSYAVHRVLFSGTGRGAVPTRHIVQDFNDDGEFDNYFHLKAICINGVIGTDTSAHVVFNGSANTSGGSSLSDEQTGIFDRKRDELAYQNYVDYWFTHAPPLHGRDYEYERSAPGYWRNFYKTTGVDPYAHVDMD